MSTVSENIRYLRKLNGYTQEQFAERIGIKRSLLGAYEEARANPNEIYLDSMAEVLGVSVENLLTEDLRGGRSGSATILKLNNRLPVAALERPAPEPVSVESREEQEDFPRRRDQMDLFGQASTERERKTPPMPDIPRTEARPEVNTGSDFDFIAMLRSMLSVNPSFKLFSEPEDVPVKDLHVIGSRVERADEVESNALYILVTKTGEVLFRRVFNQVKVKGTLILSSDFPDKPTLELPISGLSEVYRYHGSFQTSPPSATAPVKGLRELTEQMMHLLSGVE